MTFRFAPLQRRSYGLISADPPWLFELRSKAGEAKSPQAHYGCMPLTEIADLPVAELALDDCWLCLWATAPMLPEALFVMRSWGFAYKTHIAWRKLSANGVPMRGTGFIAASMHEVVLIGARGEPPCGPAMPSLFDGERREHSRKPEAYYALVERFHPLGRRLDLFSRQSRPGWDAWGNEAGKFDARDGLTPRDGAA